MKKIFSMLLVLAIYVSTSFSQIVNEQQLKIKPNLDLSKIESSIGNVDCKCGNNLLVDGGFQNVSIVGSGSVPSNISSSSNPWKPSSNSPQWSSTAVPFACDKGVVSMWGNKVVGESIYQTGLTFAPGSYKVKFTARIINNTSPIKSIVRLKLATYLATGTGDPGSYDGKPGLASTDITSTSWETYSFTFSTGAANSITLHPENNSSVNDGAEVSWIQLDNICIEKVCDIPNEKCNPKFTVSPFTLNEKCQLIINTIPTVTSGAQHYWGAVYASGISDNTPIPLSTILTGGTWGLSVSSTGVVAQLGLGTGINGGSTGYGYNYLGFPLGKCFKITHYIKCCDKWYSQTNTYCPKICNETKEGSVIEVSSKDVPNLDVKPGQGRG